jgi:hypothetical protein
VNSNLGVGASFQFIEQRTDGLWPAPAALDRALKIAPHAEPGWPIGDRDAPAERSRMPFAVGMHDVFKLGL